MADLSATLLSFFSWTRQPRIVCRSSRQSSGTSSLISPIPASAPQASPARSEYPSASSIGYLRALAAAFPATSCANGSSGAAMLSPARLEPGRSVVDIAFGWGFNSMATFYRAFANEFGAAPVAFREALQGEGG
jgi:AraC-like DNA-binding protein